MPCPTRLYRSLSLGQLSDLSEWTGSSPLQARTKGQEIPQQTSSGPQAWAVRSTPRLGRSIPQQIEVERKCWRRRLDKQFSISLSLGKDHSFSCIQYVQYQSRGMHHHSSLTSNIIGYNIFQGSRDAGSIAEWERGNWISRVPERFALWRTRHVP
jgi:hypothetical protein